MAREMIPSGRGKRPRAVGDPAPSRSSVQIPSRSSKRESVLADPPHHLSGEISSRGAKRARALPGWQTPFWGAKRARSVVGGPPPPISSPSHPKWRDWANLGVGLAGLITERLLDNDVADYIRFRGVCREWRHWSADPRARGVLDRRFHRRNWIMLRETVAAPHHRRLLNVSTGQCVWAHLPELAGHDVFGPTNAEGLLVLLDKATYVVRLLNPLTHQAADLPPATTLYRLWQRGHERPTNTDPRKDFEVSAAGLADDTTVAVFFHGIQMLAVAKPGDEQWTLVDQGNYLRPAISFVSFAGRFYCTSRQAVVVVETTANQPPRLVVAAELAIQFSGIMSTEHLVDNAGELMLVYRIAGSETIHEGYDSDDYQERCVVQYKAYRVDLDARKTKPTRGLGGQAVFIGARRAISVSPLVFPSIRNDSVYLGMDRMLGSAGESTTGPHHFVDGTAMSYGEGSCCPERCDSGEDSVPEYGPGSIDEYLSRYVTGSRDNSEDT